MLTGIILYIFCGFFALLVIGEEERTCNKFISEVPVAQMCDETDNFYSFPNKGDLDTNIYMNRSSLHFNVSTYCTCDITIHPIPQVISWRYRTSLLDGCRLLTWMSENNTQHCLTDTLHLKRSLENETVFHTHTANSDSYVCFSIGIEDPYVEGRSFSVTCPAAETSPIPLDADPNAFEISTKLEMLVVQLENVTDPALKLTYNTALVFERKRYETSTLWVKPKDIDANQEASNTTKEDREAFGTNDAIQVDNPMIRNVIIASAGGVGLILLVAAVLVYLRHNRRKNKVATSVVRYTITVQRNDDEDLVITDNLVYNLDEGETNVENNVNDESNHYAVVNKHEDVGLDVQGVYTNTNHVEVEYTNSLEIGIVQSEKYNSNPKAITDEGKCQSKQDVRTDDEKMDFYSNKSIGRNKSLVIETEQVYSNEFCEESSENFQSENDTNDDLHHSL